MSEQGARNLPTLEIEDLLQQIDNGQINLAELQSTLDKLGKDRLKLSRQRAAITLENWANRIRCYYILLLVFCEIWSIVGS